MGGRDREEGTTNRCDAEREKEIEEVRVKLPVVFEIERERKAKLQIAADVERVTLRFCPEDVDSSVRERQRVSLNHLKEKEE